MPTLEDLQGSDELEEARAHAGFAEDALSCADSCETREDFVANVKEAINEHKLAVERLVALLEQAFKSEEA